MYDVGITNSQIPAAIEAELGVDDAAHISRHPGTGACIMCGVHRRLARVPFDTIQIHETHHLRCGRVAFPAGFQATSQRIIES